MRNAQNITRNDPTYGSVWTDSNALDLLLFENNLLRSDAGSMPADSINVARIEGEDPSLIATIIATLAIQRAVLTICSCDENPGTSTNIKKSIKDIPRHGELHDALLQLDLRQALTKGIDAHPPRQVHQYTEGLVARLLGNAVNSMEIQTYEQLGVANDLSDDEDIYAHILLTTNYTLLPSRGAADVTGVKNQSYANAIAWIVRNPNASNERAERYLSAYSLTMKDVENHIQHL